MIVSFWRSVATQIKLITDQDIPFTPKFILLGFTPEFILLGLWSNWEAPSLTKLLVAVLLPSAKSVIAQLWTDRKAPIISNYYKMWDFIMMDKLSEQIKLSQGSSFHSRIMDEWKPYPDYLLQKDPIDRSPPDFILLF